VTVPCDKGPALERIEIKLDRLTEVITESAVTRNNVLHLQEGAKKIDQRVSELENVPKKAMIAAFLAAMAAVVQLLFSGWGR